MRSVYQAKMFRRARLQRLVKKSLHGETANPAPRSPSPTVAPSAAKRRRLRALPDAAAELPPSAFALSEFLERLFVVGTLSAGDVTQVAHLIKEAGPNAAEAVSHLALPPSPGGNAARKLNRVLGITGDVSRMYVVKVPITTSTGSRRTVWYPILLPHEEIARAYAAEGGRDVFLHHVNSPTSAVPGFLQHALTVEHGASKVVPLMLFVDAAGFTRQDSFIAQRAYKTQNGTLPPPQPPAPNHAFQSTTTKHENKKH